MLLISLYENTFFDRENLPKCAVASVCFTCWAGKAVFAGILRLLVYVCAVCNSILKEKDVEILSGGVSSERLKEKNIENLSN
ncbi:MAG: hypothetical protein K2X81_24795 [Candidatus Obscuribacterales bacterium]|nr:hypothetical protein [Candidatus Obscuribacterales bacterium]